MEMFSEAYVRAIAAAAGYTVERKHPDIEKIDLMVTRETGVDQVAVQLKSKSYDGEVGETIPYEIEVDLYDVLRKKTAIPRLLVLVLMPQERAEWLSQSPSSLALRRCGYFLSLRGYPEVPNKSSYTVHIPRDQIFTVEALPGLADCLALDGAR